MGPLAGITVIEMAGIGPTPFAGMALADLGAEVILIERKPANGNAGSNDCQRRTELFHRGKKSMAVDLKSPQAQQLLLQLISQADVLLEGYRPNVMERLGLGPEPCINANPNLIYARLTGYGQSGPLAQATGHEPNYTGLSGALWYGGRPQHEPTAPLTTMGDVGGGSMVLIMGILSALLHVSKGGQGQVVDAAISDGSAYLSTLMWTLKHAGHIDEQFGHGWADGAAPWNQTYQCSDGQYVTVCALEPPFYQALLQGLALTSEPLLQQQWNRTKWPEATSLLRQIFRAQPQQHWCELFDGSDACVGPVLSFEQAAQHPHNQQRNTFVKVNELTQPAPAPRFSHSTTEVGSVPAVGGHNDELLRRFEIDAELQQQLRHSGTI
ncbi:CaiB/BaiF CoA transferase family protein [Ferrimonas lipolytica]|uniref:CoA transferase n=1 Tax=Ferrimonas lipolytica TaxID=2724191 RepID=A0A6H1UDY3_9GAMM|nr:CaiB/BaiF CoA-transferase family protein [Ferrimonas lipolytica]QIZ77291.1 CoA transferase [Ferrimonas lipolytica]